MGALKDYFSFSKRERIGAIVLVLLVVIVFVLPEFFPARRSSLDASAVAEFKRKTDELRTVSAESESMTEPVSSSTYETRSERALEKAVLFPFDPNTISEDGWRKLGISDRTIQTIQKYISRGGSFRKPDDLSKIYGIGKDQYDQLRPYVKIQQQNIRKPGPEKFQYARPPNDNTFKAPPSIVEINTADTSGFIALPGIGSRLANRIITFRGRLGGFYSVEQLREVYGIPDSTFQKIVTFLRCDGSVVQQVNINTAEADVLKNHPYIKWNIANAIVNYRKQHGNYKALEDLLGIDIISPEVYKKLVPYLKID